MNDTNDQLYPLEDMCQYLSEASYEDDYTVNIDTSSYTFHIVSITYMCTCPFFYRDQEALAKYVLVLRKSNGLVMIKETVLSLESGPPILEIPSSNFLKVGTLANGYYRRTMIS